MLGQGCPRWQGGQADSAMSTPAHCAQAGGCGARAALGGQPILEVRLESWVYEDSGWQETSQSQHRREEARGSQRASSGLPQSSARGGSIGQSWGGDRTRKQGTGWAHTSPCPQPHPGGPLPPELTVGAGAALPAVPADAGEGVPTAHAGAPIHAGVGQAAAVLGCKGVRDQVARREESALTRARQTQGPHPTAQPRQWGRPGVPTPWLR